MAASAVWDIAKVAFVCRLDAAGSFDRYQGKGEHKANDVGPLANWVPFAEAEEFWWIDFGRFIFSVPWQFEHRAVLPVSAPCIAS